MSITQDDALLEETFKFISTTARDQDVIYFFASLAMNDKARRKLTKYLQDEYDVVSTYISPFYSRLGLEFLTRFAQLYKRFEGNFTLGSLVSVSFRHGRGVL